VLGGTGFVGSQVVQALVARGASVTSVSRSGKPAAIAGADQVTIRLPLYLTRTCLVVGLPLYRYHLGLGCRKVCRGFKQRTTSSLRPTQPHSHGK
jgi:hypothetical protein